MTKEIRAFIDFLEELLRKKLDWDRLGEYLDNQEQVFQIWWEINELRKARPGPMHSRDFWTIMVPCLYMSSEKESLEGYRAVYREVKARVDAGIGAVAEEKYRLMFSQLPPYHSLDFFDQLAEKGWNFVCESPSYHPPPPIELEGTSDPVERIARWTYWWRIYHGWHAAKKGYPRLGYPQPAYNYSREYNVDGFMAHHLISCRTATFWLTHSMNVLRERLGVPGMNMEGDIVDLTVFNPATVLNMVEPFMDIMDHYREQRRSMGLDW
ncbi:MAG: 2-hydroxyacyl-CoA dehydratase [Deltaproteobacteria bacterium]|nr:2-hydroxyacyl-CoA dehydratase [Deltaproteobacteria bacterium]